MILLLFLFLYCRSVLYRDEMIPPLPLQELSSLLYYTLLCRICYTIFLMEMRAGCSLPCGLVEYKFNIACRHGFPYYLTKMNIYFYPTIFGVKNWRI